LAIAQSVVSDHHGRISVSSRKNQGTTFHVELPLARDGVGEKKTDAAAGGRS